MSAATSIEWTDATWNPTRGCSRVSEGCRHCYAERVAARFARQLSGRPGPFHGFAQMTKGGPRWTGRVELLSSALDLPLRWRKPRRIFVNSMSDLFHEALVDGDIDLVFAAMALAPHHTFQILTKRPERMRRWFNETFSGASREQLVANQMLCPEWLPQGRSFPRYPAAWPLPNVWLGVSVEGRANRDRIDELRVTPAALRFLSIEPLLEDIGAIDLRGIRWVIVGGESGHGARRFDVAWARSTARQCRRARVPVFVKQLGGNVIDRNDAGFEAEGEVWADGPEAGRPTNPQAWPTPHGGVEDDINGYREDYQGAPVRVHMKNRKGGDMAEWPEDLRVREFPGVAMATAEETA